MRFLPPLFLLASISLVAVPIWAEPSSENAQLGEVTPLTQPSKPTATWVGFRKTGPKSALVYVHLTESVEVSSVKDGNKYVFTLKGTRVHVKNNKNPLIAKHFDSVVESARLIPRGDDLQLVIELKRNAKESHRINQESPGAVLYVELSEN